MDDTLPRVRCQRCGEQMDLKDPAAGMAWPQEQYWVCPACGRHFWSTFPAPGGKERPAAAKPGSGPAMSVPA